MLQFANSNTTLILVEYGSDDIHIEDENEYMNINFASNQKLCAPSDDIDGLHAVFAMRKKERKRVVCLD
jgi:hypothetical protein